MQVSIEQVDGQFRAQYDTYGVVLTASHVREARGGLWAELRIEDLFGTLLHFGRADLLAGHWRRQLAQSLEKQHAADWASLLEDFSLRVVEAWREEQQERAAADAAIVSAADLLSQEFPEPRWVVPDLLPEGLVVLAGKPKCGKSWFALNVAVAAATGGVALGRLPCEPGRVLYVALEDSPKRLHRRLRALLRDTRPEGLDRLEVATGWPRLDQGGVERLEAWLRAHPDARLVVIDTFARVRGPGDSRGNAYQLDYVTLAPLADLARRHGVCVLLVHHLRKAAAEDPVDLVSGSAGVTGAADAVLVLRRPRGSPEGTLYATGRDLEEQELALRFGGGLWTLEGPAAHVAATREQNQVLEALRALGGEASPKEVAEALSISPTAARLRMFRLVQEGLLATTARGRYTLADPLRERLRTDERSERSERMNASGAEPLEAFKRSSVHECSLTQQGPPDSPPGPKPLEAFERSSVQAFASVHQPTLARLDHHPDSPGEEHPPGPPPRPGDLDEALVDEDWLWYVDPDDPDEDPGPPDWLEDLEEVPA